MLITWDAGVICKICIYKSGNRRFDRTGFNCENTLYDYQQQYGIIRQIQSGEFGAYSIGHREFLWCDDYPNSFELSYFSN